MMQALVCEQTGTPATVLVRDIETPRPGDADVLIDVSACAVNYPDVLMLAGAYQFKPELPFVPGSEVSGVVSAIGADVRGIRPGDHVIAPVQTGGMAEKVAVPASLVTPVPNDVGLVEASTLLYAYGTAHYALHRRGRLQRGENLLVLGAAGGVGMAALQLGAMTGARVIAAASTREKLDLCIANGAHEVINYADEDLRQRVRELTAGSGVDVVLDPVGGALSETAFRTTAWDGRFLVVGFAAGQIGRLPLNLPLLRGSSVVGVFWGSFVERCPDEHQQIARDLVRLLAEGAISPYICERYRLQDAPTAISRLAERRARGKVVVVIDGA